jgi:hypothetical protein
MSQGSVCDENIRLLEIYRTRIVNEDSLVNYRMTWLIAEEAILFAALGIIYTTNIQLEPKFITGVLLCVAGFAVAIFGLSGVRAAQKEIDRLDKLSAPIPRPDGYPPLKSTRHHIPGHLIAWVLPILTAAMWVYILLIIVTGRLT